MTATAGGNAITDLGYTDTPQIINIEAKNQYVAASLSSTGYGIFRHSFLHNNVSDCFVMQNPTIVPQYQWYLDTVLCESNGGRGPTVIAPAGAAFTGTIANTTLTVASGLTGTLLVGETVTGATVTMGTIITAFGTGTGGLGTYTVNNSQSISSEALATSGLMTMGTWTNVFSFGNTGKGASFLGNSSVRIYGVRIFGGFLGTDGDVEAYFDTYSGGHEIASLFTELSGTNSCIQFTANNTDAVLSGVVAHACKTAGINNAATTLLSIVGGSLDGNGTYGLLNSGVANMSGVSCLSNTTANVSNSGALTWQGLCPTSGYTIANLPACPTATAAGQRAYVTNGVAAPALGSAVSTTGTTVDSVLCSAAGWVYG